MDVKSKGKVSKSGVFIFHSYKENIIVDKYHPIFTRMRESKLNALYSENSEDAITNPAEN